MKIQKLMNIGVVVGVLAYCGYSSFEDFRRKSSNDLVKARENSKMILRQSAPEKYDSLMNLGIGFSRKAEDIKKWLDTEVEVLDSLNNQANYNKGLQNVKAAAKDSLKVIK